MWCSRQTIYNREKRLKNPKPRKIIVRTSKKTTIKFETIPGLQAQVDWKVSMQLENKNGEIQEIIELKKKDRLLEVKIDKWI